MKWAHHPIAGFRFSIADLIAIIVCAVGTLLAWSVLGNFALLFPIVLGHFFLFCNIFRIRRNYELAWAALFIINVGWHVLGATGEADWSRVLLIQFPITLFFIVLEMRGGRYHGIGYRWINPDAENFKKAEIQN